MRLENTTGSSSKFWEVQVNGTEYTVTYGKIGAKKPRVHKKTFPTADAAQKAADKAIKEKTRNGYTQVDSFVTSTTPADIPAAPAPANVGTSALAARVQNLAPMVDLKQFTRAQGALRTLDERFEEFAKGLAAFQPTARQLESMPSFYAMPAGAREGIEARMATWQKHKAALPKLFTLGPPGSAPVADVQALIDFITDFKAFQKTAFKKPPMRLYTKAKNLEDALIKADWAFPATVTPPPAKLDATGFAALSDDAKKDAWRRREEIGYQVVDADTGDKSYEEYAAQVVSKEAVDDLIDEVVTYADDLDEENDEFSETPSVIDIQELKNGDEVLGYRLEASLHSDSGNIGIFFYMMADANGHVFERPTYDG